jgi:hypothetical protein
MIYKFKIILLWLVAIHLNVSVNGLNSLLLNTVFYYIDLLNIAMHIYDHFNMHVVTGIK